MKKLLLTVLFLVSMASLSAQENVIIQGNEAELPSMDIAARKSGQWSVEGNLAGYAFLPMIITANGVWEYKFNSWFKLGAGVGITSGFFFPMLDSGWGGVNAIGRIGFDINTKRRVSPFFTMDLGTTLCITPNRNVEFHNLLIATIGIAIKQRHRAGKLLVGITGNVMWSLQADYIALPCPGVKIGYAF